MESKPLTNMEDILGFDFGEAASTVRASFKKTVYVKQYETEVVEVSSQLNFDKELSGTERMLYSAILQAQIEYESLCQLAFKGFINQNELVTRRNALIEAVEAMRLKAEAMKAN